MSSPVLSTSRTFAFRDRLCLPVYIALILITLLGLGLRLMSAQGDFWLDEVWSLRLVAPLAHFWEVFWKISHDNNHFMNSLWLFLVGSDQSIYIYRLPSLVMGGISIWVAGLVGLRHSKAECVALALLVSCSVMFVHYGSEARGYSGLILAMLTSVLFFDLMMAAEVDGNATAMHRSAWFLGGALGLGAFNHLTIVMMAVSLGLTALIVLNRRLGSLSRAVGIAFRLFAPSLLLLLPIIAALAAGYLYRGQFKIGGVTPFSVDNFIIGYGAALGFGSGLYDFVPLLGCILLIPVLCLVAFWGGFLNQDRATLALISLVFLPCLMFVAGLSNVQYSRYFLVCVVVLILVLAEIIGAMWSRGGVTRVFGVLIAGLVLAGQVMPLSRLFEGGRGGYRHVTALLGASNGIYDSNFTSINEAMISFYATRQGLTLRTARSETYCAEPPDNYVLCGAELAAAPLTLEAGPEACRKTFKRVTAFEHGGLSGWQLVVYQRVP